MQNDFLLGFKKGFRGAWKYGYFAPLTALYFSMTRRIPVASQGVILSLLRALHSSGTL
jgi:hypothetical protein